MVAGLGAALEVADLEVADFVAAGLWLEDLGAEGSVAVGFTAGSAAGIFLPVPSLPAR